MQHYVLSILYVGLIYVKCIAFDVWISFERAYVNSG